MSLPLLTFFIFSLTSSCCASSPMAEIINPKYLSSSKRFEGSSDLVNLKYHMGPVLSSSPIKIYIIWYGRWAPQHRLLITDFLSSFLPPPSSSSAAAATVSGWWSTVTLYTDQTGANVSRTIIIAGEHSDHRYSQGTHLTRLAMQHVISNAVKTASLPIDHRNGVYLILTSDDVTVEEFCRAVCGFHYFTFPSVIGATIPYAWVGNSGKQCPDFCAYPFAVPRSMAGGTPPPALRPPNGDVGVDGMVSVIGHELAEMSTNPLINAWYAGDDPIAPTEIADLCLGLYGSGGGGGYMGQVMRDKEGKTFNLFGKSGRKFLIQYGAPY